jgi:hypothetical protein
MLPLGEAPFPVYGTCGTSLLIVATLTVLFDVSNIYGKLDKRVPIVHLLLLLQDTIHAYIPFSSFLNLVALRRSRSRMYNIAQRSVALF